MTAIAERGETSERSPTNAERREGDSEPGSPLESRR